MTFCGVSNAMMRAEVHDGDLVDEAHQHVDVVLDHQHGAALLGCMSRMLSTSPATSPEPTPGHRLVEQHDARVRRQQHGDLELALVAVRDVAGGGVELVAEADGLELREGQLGRGIRSPRKAQQRVVAAERDLRGEPHVLEHAEPREEARGLEGAPQSRPRPRGHGLPRDVGAVHQDATRRGLHEAGDHVEERGLSGAVGPDDADERAGRRRRGRHPSGSSRRRSAGRGPRSAARTGQGCS